MFRQAWLLPHLLGLDAPLVALVWQAWWERAAGATLLPGHRAALGLAVWAIYLADRLADVRVPERADTATSRHRFSRRWRGPLGFLLMVAAVALAGVTLGGGLPTRDVAAGLALAAVMGGYFAWVHGGAGRPGFLRGWWKEAWVGAAFAAGTALFVRERLTGGQAVAVGLFGAVCFVNCAMITRWELNAGASAPRGAFLRPVCGGIALLAAGLALAGRGMFPTIPVAFAAAGLRLLDGPAGRGMAPETRRVLADVVLLTPLWWLLRGP